MRDIVWRLGATLAALAVLARVGSVAGASAHTHRVVRELDSRSEAQLPSCLLASGPDLEHRMVDVTWRCPVGADIPDGGSSARVWVAFRSGRQAETTHIFDLPVPYSDPGGAAGYPALVYVYPEGASPLDWPWRRATGEAILSAQTTVPHYARRGFGRALSACWRCWERFRWPVETPRNIASTPLAPASCDTGTTLLAARLTQDYHQAARSHSGRWQTRPQACAPQTPDPASGN
jgi:hypothetical protein